MKPSYHRLPLAPGPEVPGALVGQADTDEGLSGDAHMNDEHGARRRELMQIGDLAREGGKTVRAIHLYEELGLLAPAGRSKGGFRLYGAEALTRIRWIAKLQEMGFSL